MFSNIFKKEGVKSQKAVSIYPKNYRYFEPLVRNLIKRSS